MSNISFVKQNATPVEGVVVESVNTGPAESVPSTSLTRVPAESAVTPPAAFDDSNIGISEIIIPRLSIVQKVGDLSEVFNPGEIVLNKSTVVHIPANKEKGVAGSGPLVFIPIGFKKTQFVEKVSGGGRGLFVNTEQEVVDAGGTLDYKEWDASRTSAKPLKRFERYATALILVERPTAIIPDEEHQVFTHEVEGKFYALALLGMKGTAYTGLAKLLFTARKIGHLKGGYPTFSWNLTTEIKSFPGADGGKNYAAVPILTNGSRTTPALLQYVKDSLGFGA